MKVYVCNKCNTAIEDIASGNILEKNTPCVLTVEEDEDFPLFCSYNGEQVKWKQKYPKDKKVNVNPMNFTMRMN